MYTCTRTEGHRSNINRRPEDAVGVQYRARVESGEQTDESQDVVRLFTPPLLWIFDSEGSCWRINVPAETVRSVCMETSPVTLLTVLHQENKDVSAAKADRLLFCPKEISR